MKGAFLLGKGLMWTAIVLGTIALVFGTAWFVYVGPSLMVSQDGVSAGGYLKAITDTRATLVQAFGGVAVLIAAVVGALTLRHNVRAHAGTLAVAQRGQVTDRFTRAVAQLGSEKLDVRVGGVYALEQIARDAPDLHPPIIEILTAFVREHARRRPGGRWTKTGHPTSDIEAIFGVLKRRETSLDRGDIDLGHTDLSGLDLSGISLVGANLTGTCLSMVSLEHANLSRASVFFADLGAADLNSANFQNARLRQVQMNGATSMVGTDFSHATLVEIYLDGATLDEANVTGADISGLRKTAPAPSS